MRRTLSFLCEGATLAATLDEAPGTSGLLIVSGGNEIRIGAHRGMARLAADVAAAGHPVFRFDRRGIGDSEGENGGFLSSGPDIRAAIDAFKSACPQVKKLVCFGNCDAATSLILHDIECEADVLVLANPWIVEPVDDLPPPAAIKAHYRQRLRDPKAWIGLLTGGINIRKALAGIRRISAPPPKSSLADEFSMQMSLVSSSLTAIKVIVASRDATAIAFLAEWQLPGFDVDLISLDSASHSFAGDADYAALKATILKTLV